VTLATALLLATSAAALAQAPQGPPLPGSPPAARTQAPMWYAHQADEMRASKLIGMKVVNTANETVGEINEIVLDKHGKVAAAIIGVGGFLGMGEREVAISFDAIQRSSDKDSNLVLTVNATKDSLKDAPAWRWDNPKK
jgi:sporulation protein YlmC with PRC-barrel domain